MPGYDKNPLFSPDGTLLAFESMERDGYESDKNRLMVLELATDSIKDLTRNLIRMYNHRSGQ
jgi:Tol biopolymer transport system component